MSKLPEHSPSVNSPKPSDNDRPVPGEAHGPEAPTDAGFDPARLEASPSPGGDPSTAAAPDRFSYSGGRGASRQHPAIDCRRHQTRSLRLEIRERVVV